MDEEEDPCSLTLCSCSPSQEWCESMAGNGTVTTCVCNNGIELRVCKTSGSVYKEMRGVKVSSSADAFNCSRPAMSCLNGGSCQPATYKCRCEPGWAGTRCAYDLQNCSASTTTCLDEYERADWCANLTAAADSQKLSCGGKAADAPCVFTHSLSHKESVVGVLDPESAGLALWVFSMLLLLAVPLLVCHVVQKRRRRSKKIIITARLEEEQRQRDMHRLSQVLGRQSVGRDKVDTPFIVSFRESVQQEMEMHRHQSINDEKL